MVCEDVLRVKNLPNELSDAEKKDFLTHFGAIEVKVITSKSKQTSIAFAKFESNEIAKNILLRLHQLTVLNSRLCVEYAENDIGDSLPKVKTKESLESTNKKHFKSFINRLNAFNNSVSFNQPPPSHLKYIYPKPNRATINNIAHALGSVPKFYTQVLHLMNRMNLPPPFSDIPDTPAVPQKQPSTNINKSICEREVQTDESRLETSESELESDNEGDVGREIIPQKRIRPQKRVVKRPKLIKPSLVQTPTTHKPQGSTGDVFEKVDMLQHTKIQVTVSADALEQKSRTQSQPEEPIGTFGLLEPQEEVEQKLNEMSVEELHIQEKKCITEEELAANRIEPKDLNVLTVFKNYHPGAPTCRLYIKNIAKTVKTEDLEYIYSRYTIEVNPEKTTQFDIRLMQEGRMKGQAFVTLDSVELAQKAMKETNGYILKEKPLVVVFARSAAPKP